MGMFDEVRCEYPLPTSDYQGEQFQTKSLDCDLTEYAITEDGELIGRKGGEDRSMEDFIGEIRFYTNIGNHDFEEKFWAGWIEYSAYFVRGQLKELHLIEHKPRTPMTPTPAPPKESEA